MESARSEAGQHDSCLFRALTPSSQSRLQQSESNWCWRWYKLHHWRPVITPAGEMLRAELGLHNRLKTNRGWYEFTVGRLLCRCAELTLTGGRREMYIFPPTSMLLHFKLNELFFFAEVLWILFLRHNCCGLCRWQQQLLVKQKSTIESYDLWLCELWLLLCV